MDWESTESFSQYLQTLNKVIITSLYPQKKDRALSIYKTTAEGFKHLKKVLGHLKLKTLEGGLQKYKIYCISLRKERVFSLPPFAFYIE